MAPIPGYFEEFAQYWGWSKTQVIAYLSADYLIIALYGFLLLIALRNAWVIFYKQSEYKKILILAFYSFAILAVSLTHHRDRSVDYEALHRKHGIRRDGRKALCRHRLGLGNFCAGASHSLRER